MTPTLVPGATQQPTLGTQLRAVHSLNDLETFLGVTHRLFTFLFYAKPPSKRYNSFTIKKKNGKPRLIDAPILPIRKIQRKLATALLEIHKPRKAVYGFARDRSIVGNAEAHCRRPWVLNIDLRDFFHSVHFGRIRGIFAGWRFRFSKDVATALATICCHRGRLAQGAPTSPIISNIATDHLDADLMSFARRHGCRYTRYCDDITISTTRRDFPNGIATVAGGGAVVLSDALLKIISKHRVVVNDEKVRLYSRRVRQEVTGLTTNAKPNTTRRYVRQVRAMLHAWHVYGRDAAQKEFLAKYDGKKDRGPRHSPPRYELVVRGKIEFIGAVRGHGDPVYVKFLRYYMTLDTSSKSKVLAMIDAEERDVFICHASEDKERVVLPLVEALENAGISYFLDSKEIMWGDSVTNVINTALVRAKYVIVAISAKSLKKHWPVKEMNAALAREISEGKTRVLPLLVGSNHEECEALWRQLALQGDKRYLEWTGDTGPILKELAKVLGR